MNFEIAEHPIKSTTLVAYVMCKWTDLFGMSENGNLQVPSEIVAQKLSYMVYGFYLASTRKSIVFDEKPIAGKSGPMFLSPHIDIFFDTNIMLEKYLFGSYNYQNAEDNILKQIIEDVVSCYGYWDEKRLIAWSFLKDSPRTKTREEKGLTNKKNYINIDDTLTYEYFVDKTSDSNILIRKRVKSKEIEELYNKITKNTNTEFRNEGVDIHNIKEHIENKKDKAIQELKEKDFKEEIFDYDKKKKENEIETLELKLYELKLKNEYRNRFVKWVIKLVGIFLVCSGVVVTAGFWLSDSVKIAILSSTTATIIGLPLVIVRGLFLDKDTK